MPAENKSAAFVPLISSSIAGPLGVLHLPRFWSKVLLSAKGLLHEDYVGGGFDDILLDVLLPDHLHCIWTLPHEDSDFSTRWRLVKSYFSHHCESRYRGKVSASRKEKKEQAIWQRRFWEHVIRDDEDFIKHVEYIHYNPVKHDLVKAPKDWEYSSFHRYVRAGIYDEMWGAGQEISFDVNIGNE